VPKIEDFDSRHWRAAEMHFEGHTQAEIAEAVGVNPSTVFRWIRDGKLDPIIVQLADDIHRAVRTRLVRSSLRAAIAAAEVLESEDDGKKLAAAFGILDRTGHPKAERIEMDAKVDATVDTSRPIDALDSMMTGGGGEQ